MEKNYKEIQLQSKSGIVCEYEGVHTYVRGECVWVCQRLRLCVGVCVWVRVSMCACEWERERERERANAKRGGFCVQNVWACNCQMIFGEEQPQPQPQPPSLFASADKKSLATLIKILWQSQEAAFRRSEVNCAQILTLVLNRALQISYL